MSSNVLDDEIERARLDGAVVGHNGVVLAVSLSDEMDVASFLACDAMAHVNKAFDERFGIDVAW